MVEVPVGEHEYSQIRVAWVISCKVLLPQLPVGSALDESSRIEPRLMHLQVSVKPVELAVVAVRACAVPEPEAIGRSLEQLR